jgi:hypothetical protein
LIVALIGILLPLLIGISIILWIIDIPRKVGSHLTFEQGIRKVLFRVLDPEEMRSFRDDMMHIVESEIDENGDWDRWGLLREIDTAQNEIEDQLKDGEFAFTFVGGAAALVVGSLFGITSGGVVLTLVGLFFSVLVALRIIITDTLCYRSINHRNDPLHRLVILKGWNRGAVFGSGAMAIAILSVFVSQGGGGYRIGIGLLERLTEWKFNGENKWQID